MFNYIADVRERDLSDARGREYVIKTLKEISMLLGEKDIENVHKRLESLLFEIGLETDLSVLRIKTKDDIETIIAHSFNQTNSSMLCIGVK